MKIPERTLACTLASAALACLLSGQLLGAAEKVAARTLPQSSTTDGAADQPGSLLRREVPKVDVPVAEFTDNAADTSARDPFFPNNSYRKIKPARVEPDRSPEVSATVLDPLKLTGVGGVGDNRWAMLNGVTLYLGESAVVRVGAKAYEIVCHEITDKSVTVGLKNQDTRRVLKIE